MHCSCRAKKQAKPTTHTEAPTKRRSLRTVVAGGILLLGLAQTTAACTVEPPSCPGSRRMQQCLRAGLQSSRSGSAAATRLPPAFARYGSSTSRRGGVACVSSSTLAARRTSLGLAPAGRISRGGVRVRTDSSNPLLPTAVRGGGTAAAPSRFLSSGESEAEESAYIDNGDDVNGAQPKQSRKAATGWNHNLPSDSSSFWAVEEDQSRTGSDESRGANDSGKATTGEPRTGWLHNTQPKTKAQESATAAGDTSSAGNKPRESDARKRLRLEKEKKMRNHRLLGPPTFHPCGDGRRVVVTEHRIAVPLSRGKDGSADNNNEEAILPGVGGDFGVATIDVFFTVVELVQTEKDGEFFEQTLTLMGDSTKSGVWLQNERADLYVRHANLTDADGMILYLQGGPGFGAPAPVSGIGLGEKSSWAAEALSRGFKRVVLMDQRGTGRSTPITKQTLQKRFPDLFALDDIASVTDVDEDYSQSTGAGMSIAEQLDRWEAMNPDLSAKVGVGVGQAAEYMSNFRADSIVRDAEDIKTALLLPPEDESEKAPRPWGGALGQSFGGFCMMTYLSQVLNPPKICLLTGGIAPMLTPAFEAYDRLWQRVKERNLRYYDRYPGDIPVVKRIVRRLLERPAALPSGGKLTARRFLQLGLGLGGSPSAFPSLHSLLASAFLDDADDEFSRSFLKRIETEQSFDDNPIYFLMHESIYADGAESSPTDWAAHRAYEDRTRTPSEFRYDLTSSLETDQNPTLFFGEMVFPWMADGDYAELSGFGMRALAQSLATKDDWEPLYNSENMRRALAPGGASKAAAAVYYDDMYVDFDCSMKVTARGGPLENCKVWITNDYQHSGLRDDGSTIFAKILGMAKGSVGTPS